MFEGNYWRARSCELHRSIIKTIRDHTYGNKPPKGKRINPVVARRIKQIPKRKQGR